MHASALCAGLADVARVYRTCSGPQTSRRAATPGVCSARIFFTRRTECISISGGVRDRAGRIPRCDFRLRGELVSLITVSVHEYDCRATRLAAARKLAWRHRLLPHSWIYVSAFSNAAPRPQDEEEDERSSFSPVCSRASFYPLARIGALERCRGRFVPTGYNHHRLVAQLFCSRRSNTTVLKSRFEIGRNFCRTNSRLQSRAFFFV